MNNLIGTATVLWFSVCLASAVPQQRQTEWSTAAVLEDAADAAGIVKQFSSGIEYLLGQLGGGGYQPSVTYGVSGASFGDESYGYGGLHRGHYGYGGGDGGGHWHHGGGGGSYIFDIHSIQSKIIIYNF